MKQRVRKPPKPTAADFLRQGNASFRAGRFFLACEAFEKAHKLEPRNAAILFNLASAKERVGEAMEAARLLTEAARYRPSWPEAPARLALVLGRYKLESPKDLDPHGLLAAFAYDTIDQRPLATACFDYLRATTHLDDKLGKAWNGDALEAAREMILRRTDRVLTDRLLHAALAAEPTYDIAMETLLTAIRHVLLLEAPAERFEDKTLTGFVMALIRQLDLNEYVFATNEAEWTALEDLPVDWSALASGDSEQARRLMLTLLYRPVQQILPPDTGSDNISAIRPRSLGDFISGRHEEHLNLAQAISDLTTAETGKAEHADPAPRWQSLQIPEKESAKALLAQSFPQEKLEFLDEPFRVFLAGVGTGKQAIAAAACYGPKADILAIDSSAENLAYASQRAAHYELDNVRFECTDIAGLANHADAPFDIIETGNALNNAADPFSQWQSLLSLLRPGGLMLVSLTSGVARRAMTALRNDTDYPGADCSDDVARQYRAALVESRDDRAARLTQAGDFYTMSGFRRLVLSEDERPIFMSEIEAFLSENSLTFRGFQLLPPIAAHFLQTYRDEKWPGSFASWTHYEEEHPRSFDPAYNFWCERCE